MAVEWHRCRTTTRGGSGGTHLVDVRAHRAKKKADKAIKAKTGDKKSK